MENTKKFLSLLVIASAIIVIAAHDSLTHYNEQTGRTTYATRAGGPPPMPYPTNNAAQLDQHIYANYDNVYRVRRNCPQGNCVYYTGPRGRTHNVDRVDYDYWQNQ